MQIHLSEIIDSEGKVIQITPELELDTISVGRISDPG